MEMMEERIAGGEPVNNKKFQQAGIGFFALNIIYFCIFFWLLPPFNLGWLAFATVVFLLLLNGTGAYYIYKGGRKLALIMAVLYGARALHSFFRLYTEEAFMAVPYVLPCIVITFYLLGRAVWDWR
jgi:hypothetical protein